MTTILAVSRLLAVMVFLTYIRPGWGQEQSRQPVGMVDYYPPGTIEDFRLSNDARFAVVAGVEGKVVSLDISSGLTRTLVDQYPNYVYATAISPRFDVVALGTLGVIDLISLAEGYHPVRTVTLGFEGIVGMLEFSPDGRALVVSSSDVSYLPVYDVATRLEVKRLGPCEGEEKIIAVSDDGRKLAAVCNGNLVRIWDLETTRVVRDIAVGPVKWVNYIRFSHDGERLLATPGEMKALEIFDLNSGALISTLKGHTEDFGYFIIVGNDLVITNSEDLTVRSWNLMTGALLKTAKVPLGMIAADGSVVLSPVEDKPGVLELWDVQTGSKLRAFDVWRGAEGPSQK